MTALSDAFGRLFEALAALASAILLAMVAVVSADILLRDAFGSGISWANEVSEYALYVITVLTAPWLLRRGQHVRIDIVLTMVPPQIAWLMEALETLLILSLLNSGLTFSQVMPVEAFLVTVRVAAFFVPAGLGVQDVGYAMFLAAFGVPNAVSVAAAFVLLKRAKEGFWTAVGYLLFLKQPELKPT